MEKKKQWKSFFICFLFAGSGTVDFDEFTEAFLKAMAPPNSDDLRRTFKSMDTNGDGTLSLEELRDALKSVGQPLSNEGLRDLFESLDTNKNGAIDFEGKTRFISYNFYLTQFVSNQCLWLYHVLESMEIALKWVKANNFLKNLKKQDEPSRNPFKSSCSKGNI